MAKLRMTIELEYDPERAYGPDGEQWFFCDVLGADSGLKFKRSNTEVSGPNGSA